MFPLDDLLRYEKVYAQDRRRCMLNQYFNKPALLLLVTVFLYGCWGSYMIQTSGLSGEIPLLHWFTFATFAVIAAGACIWLYLIRSGAKESIADLDKELTDIRREIRFQRLKR